jgi:hypothetical protein
VQENIELLKEKVLKALKEKLKKQLIIKKRR